MDTELVQHLLELFPHIEDEFIRCLYEAYKEESPDLVDMVDVVSSFEFPPIKKDIDNANQLHTNEHEDVQDHADNFWEAEISALEFETSHVTDDERTVRPSRANSTDEINIEILFKQNHNETVDGINLQKEHLRRSVSETNILFGSTCERSLDQTPKTFLSSTQSVLNKTVKVFNTKSDLILFDHKELNKTNKEYPETLSNKLSKTRVSIQAEEENKNIDKVKLLFFELPFRKNDDVSNELVVSHVNNDVDINCDESHILGFNKKKESQPTLKDNLQSSEEKNESYPEVTSTTLVSNDIKSNVNSLLSRKSQISMANSLKLDEPQPCTSKTGCMSVLIPNQSKTTVSHLSTSSAHHSQPASTKSTKTSIFEDDVEIVYEKLTVEKAHEEQTKINPISLNMSSVSKSQPSVHVHDSMQFNSPFASTKSKYLLLCEIFPDADANYLSCQSKSISSSDELLLFISKRINDKMYPKKVESDESSPEVLGFDCTVEEFLQHIPDPIAEFQSPQYIRTGYEKNAEIYLESR